MLKNDNFMRKIFTLLLPLLICFWPFVHCQMPSKPRFVASPAQIREFCLVPDRDPEARAETAPIMRASPIRQAPAVSQNGKIAAVNPVSIGSASNVFTIIRTEQNQVFASDALSTVGFVHRNNASIYGGTSGHLRYDVSINGGSTFFNDIGVLNPALTWEARYPNITLFNPIGNTNPLSSPIAVVASCLDDTNWIGQLCSQSLITTNGSPAVSYEQYDTVAMGRFVSGAACEGRPMESWKVTAAYQLGGTQLEIVASCKQISIFGITLYEKYLITTVLTKQEAPHSSPNISFSPDGNVGWVSVLASPFSAPDSILTPIFYKTTDHGASWTNPMIVNLNSIAWVADSLRTLWVDSLGNPASDGIATTGFDFDLTVDANGNPHMAVVVGSHVPGQPYAFASGLSKFLADVRSTDGGLTWSADYVSPILTFRTPVYGATASTVSMDNQPQISRSENGEYIFYSWADSDTALVTGSNGGVGFGVSENSAPNLRAAGLRVATGERTYPKLITDGDLIWEGRALFPTMAPTVLSDVNGCFQLPIVMAEMPAMEPVDPANFFYFGNDVSFCGNNFCDPAQMSLSWDAFATSGATPPCLVSIEPQSANSVVLENAFPNPAQDASIIGFELPMRSFVTLELLNVWGQTVAVIANGEFPEGNNRVKFETKGLAAGVYFYRLVTNGLVMSKRLAITN